MKSQYEYNDVLASNVTTSYKRSSNHAIHQEIIIRWQLGMKVAWHFNQWGIVDTESKPGGVGSSTTINQ